MSAFSDNGPQAALLDGGRRLHLQHGPIDLVVEADGAHEAVLAAYRHATDTFQTVLIDLVGELALLRKATRRNAMPDGPIAKAMWRATLPHADRVHVTPMAAVAGAVADHVLGVLTRDTTLERAYVNNGGDIALHLAATQVFDIGVCADPLTGRHAARIKLTAADEINGIATSGWQGRSHSLGIADAVTVLARDAASADAAATLIANAVDLPDCCRICRLPANELAPDSDLETRPVTVDVPELTSAECREALSAGCAEADRMIAQGLIEAAFLSVQGHDCAVGAKTQNVVDFLPVKQTALPRTEFAYA